MKVLLGYMGCGKSSVGEHLYKHNNLKYCDLDQYIEQKEELSIADIFKNKGEIYFRNVEHKCLKEILDLQKHEIISLGGGTPCYANNMQLINSIHNATSIYLKVNLETLTSRLFHQRQQRPLISDINHKNELKDFIRKHLFERDFYYRQAQNLIDTSGMTIEEISVKVLEF